MLQEKVVRLLIFGKSGSGKTLTGNTILGQVLSCREIPLSTYSCRIRHGTNRGNNIEVTDFTGLFDTGRTDEKGLTGMFQTVASMNPGPTAILYIISLGNRYTEEDRGFYERLKSTLGPHLAQHAIIVFTRGDDLKRKNETIEGILSSAPNHFREVFEECDRRYLVFDNTADDKQRQVDDLLQLVTKLNEEHGSIPYTCLMYCGQGKDMEDEVFRRLRKVEEDEVKNKKYVQAVEEKKRISQEEIERKNLEFERESAKLWRKDKDTKINHLETMMQMMIKSSNKQQLIANEKEETMVQEMKELRRSLKENLQAAHDLQEEQKSISTGIQILMARLDQLSWKQLCTIL